jgi:uncharacterized protein YjbI with pentapeptide repeats
MLFTQARLPYIERVSTMLQNRRIGLVFCFLTIAALLCAAQPACGAIYQWEWVNPDDHSQGKQQSTTLCPAGQWATAGPNAYFPVDDFSQAYLIGANLTGAQCWGTIFTNADFSQANLTNASFMGATLAGATLTDAVVQGTDLSSTTNQGFTSS